VLAAIRYFSYGPSFLEINKELLARYAACETEEDVKRTEEEVVSSCGQTIGVSFGPDIITSVNAVVFVFAFDFSYDNEDDESGDEDDENEGSDEEEDEDKDPFAISDDHLRQCGCLRIRVRF
jgi:pre-rRNA-processing protein TSR3